MIGWTAHVEPVGVVQAAVVAVLLTALVVGTCRVWQWWSRRP
ncbi:hypothetical protein [Luteitalea sp.]